MCALVYVFAAVRVAWLSFQDNATTRNGLVVPCRCHADMIIIRDMTIFNSEP